MAVEFDFTLLLYAVGVALLSSAIPYTLEMISLRRLAAKNFGILMSLEPAIAALAGYIFLKENLSVTQLLAIACVIAASVGSTATTRKSA
ncbi:Threonine/homoserine exporter RhtA [compost metagenome]